MKFLIFELFNIFKIFNILNEKWNQLNFFFSKGISKPTLLKASNLF